MIPLAMTEDPPVIKRWCLVCGRFTRSLMYPGYETCAEHDEPDDDDDEWWPDPEGTEEEDEDD